MASATKFFYDAEYIGACVSRILSNPFWKEENGVVGELDDKSVDTFFSHTLPSCGFHNILMDKGTVAIQVRDNLVREVDIKDIRMFVQYVLSRLPGGPAIIDRMVQKFNKFLDQKIITTLRVLDEYAPLKDRRRSAYRFYQNGAVVIESGSKEVKLIEYKDLDGFVYLSQIIDRDFDPSLLSFNEAELFSDYTDNTGFEFLKWMQNLCKVRNEEGVWVFDSKRFRSMLSSYGYLLHQHWNDYKCVIFVDDDMEQGKANGRTGKSVVLNDSLSSALNTCVIDAKTISKKGNSSSSKDFAYTFVDQSTQYICFDDACEDFAFDSLFSVITGDLTCNAKFGKMSKFSKKDKPKMSISSNHPIIGEGASYSDRQHIVPVGGFYRSHKMDLGKTPDKFHGGWLFDEEWGEQNWAEFDALCVFALQFYLQEGLVGGGYSEKYRLAKLHAATGSAELCSALYRLLQEYDGSGDVFYQKSVDGMSDEDRSRSMTEYLESACPGEEFTPNQLSSSLRLTADYYGYKVNVGHKDNRIQKRFGPGAGKAVNAYQITSTKNPFPTKKMVSDPVVVETPVAAVDLVSAGDELDNAEALFAGLSPSV
jgi:hypothetical protein